MTLRLVEADDVTSASAHGPSAPAGGVSAPPASDESLVLAAQSGDRVAFTHLYHRFGPMVHAVLLARLDRADADDVTQEVFLKAMRQLRTLRDPGAIGGWLLTLARRRATTFVRWRLRVQRLLLVRPPAEHRADAGPSAEEVLVAIRQLPDAYRETLAMRLVAQMTGPEIAARTGMSQGSVRVNLTRGMKLLRESLKDQWGEHVSEKQS